MPPFTAFQPGNTLDMMTRPRRDSIVSSIASQGRDAEYQTIPQLFDDSYLFNQLEKLSSVIGYHPVPENKSVEALEYTIKENGDIASDKYEKCTLYLERLNTNIQEYESILAQSKNVNDQLMSAITMFNSISSNTAGFVNKTKKLYEEYTELNKLYEGIPYVSQHFEALDPIMRRLNHSSSANIVRKHSFKTMLSTLDASLIFLGSHPDLKDAEKYRIKFKRCLIRACELIAHYLKNLLNQTYADINEKLSASQRMNSRVSREPLLYNKFAMIAEEYYIQIAELSSRGNDSKFERYHDEITSILNGCYDQYFQIRSKLLQPVTSSLIEEISVDERDQMLVKFVQNGKSYYQQLCIDEYKEFIKFFPAEQSRERINEWLCQLCEPLYDCARTRILRETDISMLCDSVTLFAQYYEFEENSEEYSKQFHDIKFDKIFEPIVQKLQARLILRVQIYIQENIVGFAPSKDSFIISRRKNTTEAVDQKDEYYAHMKENLQTVNTNTWDADRDFYYPTLRRALWLLSKIYEMVNSVVFDDLAHHIVHDCILSLRKAYDMAEASSSGVNNLDVKLAYLKNLLLLRQEIQNFNIQYTINETYLDFSGVEAFFKSGADAARGQNPSSIFSVAKSLVPKVVNSMIDARTELMAELRNIIKDFTDSVAKSIIEDTLEINDQNDENDLLNKNIKLRTNIEERLPRIHAQICNFIEDNEIVRHLVDALEETIIQSYNSFHDKVSEGAESGSRDKVQVAELMYSDVFADFVNKVTSRLVDVAAIS